MRRRRPARLARDCDLTRQNERAASRPPFFTFIAIDDRPRWDQTPSKTIEVHHLGPRRRKIPGELFLRVRAAVDFREGAELRVRTEDQIDAGAGPLDRIGLAVAALIRAVGAGGLPLRAHVEQVDEEVVRQRLW